MIEGAHFDGEEYAWHPDGADVPTAAWVSAVVLLLVILAAVGWLILGGGRP